MSFSKSILALSENPFSTLYDSVHWETHSKDRLLAVLQRRDGDRVPIVRTTTLYSQPGHEFSACHTKILQQMKAAFPDVQIDFNNASLEVYDPQYTTMKFHSDQALDLANGSYIALFSCYEKGDVTTTPRILRIQDKGSKQERELTLEHGSVVLFNLETNRKFLHKIIATTTPEEGNRWMGLTARLSNTFVLTNTICTQSDTTVEYERLFEDVRILGKLSLASSDEERTLFYRSKGRENSQTDFVYPDIWFTLSQSDLMAPIPRPNSDDERSIP